jgi:hypothetical protein
MPVDSDPETFSEQEGLPLRPQPHRLLAADVPVQQAQRVAPMAPALLRRPRGAVSFLLLGTL